MMTPLRASSQRTTYRAMAWATMRAFAKVKSSAMTPRQPSVPKRIEVIAVEYTRRELLPTAGLAWLPEDRPPQKAGPRRGFLVFVLPAISRFGQRPGRD